METRITLELYRKDELYGIHLGDNKGGSGINVEEETPEEAAKEIAKYIADYFDEEDEEEDGYYDINGEEVCVGDRVIWHDPDKSAIDLDRVYRVVGFRGEIVDIADDISTAEVFANELEIVER